MIKLPCVTSCPCYQILLAASLQRSLQIYVMRSCLLVIMELLRSILRKLCLLKSPASRISSASEFVALCQFFSNIVHSCCANYDYHSSECNKMVFFYIDIIYRILGNFRWSELTPDSRVFDMRTLIQEME